MHYEYLGLIEDDVQEDYCSTPTRDKQSEGDNESETGGREDEGVTRGQKGRILENLQEDLRPQISTVEHEAGAAASIALVSRRPSPEQTSALRVESPTSGDIISDDGESVKWGGYRNSAANTYSDISSDICSVGSDADTQECQHSASPACLRVPDDAAAARDSGASPSSREGVLKLGGETGGTSAQVNGHTSFKMICKRGSGCRDLVYLSFSASVVFVCVCLCLFVSCLYVYVLYISETWAQRSRLEPAVPQRR
jgi:hypothetical protein